MDNWQFGLFFAALLVGYVLVHVRVARFEEHLRGIAGLRSIDQRLAGLAASLPGSDGKPWERIEALLQRLHEDLEDLREATQRTGDQIGEAIVRIPQPVVAAATAEASLGSVLSAGERVRAVVESRLLQLGYSHLRILTSLHDAVLEGDCEVQVECERRHMPQKGRVLVRNGSVRDVSLQTVATTFP